VEEPLEVFVDGQPFYLTMRSPGDELFLAAGNCFSEGVIDSADDLDGVEYCRDVSANRIAVRVNPARRAGFTEGFRRKRSTAYSSCGICGTELIDDITRTAAMIGKKTHISLSRLVDLQGLLVAGQFVYRVTGGSHAAAVFDSRGTMLAHAEDVGRHNAFDKVIGKILFARQREDAVVALLSSRLSYEMVQKAARLGVEILAGASAPTSLGIQLAEAVGLTLVGFLRPGRCNVYSGAERITG
jgi:FdhD protein